MPKDRKVTAALGRRLAGIGGILIVIALGIDWGITRFGNSAPETLPVDPLDEELAFLESDAEFGSSNSVTPAVHSEQGEVESGITQAGFFEIDVPPDSPVWLVGTIDLEEEERPGQSGDAVGTAPPNGNPAR